MTDDTTTRQKDKDKKYQRENRLHHGMYAKQIISNMTRLTNVRRE